MVAGIKKTLRRARQHGATSMNSINSCGRLTASYSVTIWKMLRKKYVCRAP
jgi:hypothetical protein